MRNGTLSVVRGHHVCSIPRTSASVSIDGLDHLLVVANFKAALTRPVSRMNFVLAGHVVKTSCYKNVENKSPKSISEVKQPHCLTSFTSFGLPQRLKFFRKMLTQIPAFIRVPIRVSIPLLSLSTTADGLDRSPGFVFGFPQMKWDGQRLI